MKKNNKGFSLVELIIVIAIMAILVGVMAPQLIKYIEKTNVSSDAQLCKTVQTAIQTALADAAVANEAAYNPPTTGETVQLANLKPGGTVFESSVKETLGYDYTSSTNTKKQFKSTLAKKQSDMTVVFVSDSSVLCYIPSTSKNGSKTNAGSLTDANNYVIYAGPIEMY